MPTTKIKKAKSLWEKSVGLIGKDENSAIYFKTRWGIHTIGLSHPIDAIILDKNFKIVKLTRGLAPNRLFFWNPKYDRVVEFPEHEIARRKLKVGDYLKID